MLGYRYEPSFLAKIDNVPLSVSCLYLGQSCSTPPFPLPTMTLVWWQCPGQLCFGEEVPYVDSLLCFVLCWRRGDFKQQLVLGFGVQVSQTRRTQMLWNGVPSDESTMLELPTVRSQ